MANIARIKFNPATREIEIEGSEAFVKAHFNRIRSLLKPEDEKFSPKKILTTGKSRAAASPKSPQKGDIYGSVIAIIKNSPDGVTAGEIVRLTGLNKKQIQNVIFKAKKSGVIESGGRGSYRAVAG